MAERRGAGDPPAQFKAGEPSDSAEFGYRLEQAKLEALKELAYGASHEINNPLANIVARAQTLLQDERDSERRRKLVAIHRQAMRAHEMIADLMLFARPPKLLPAQCDLNEIVGKVVEELYAETAEREIKLHVGRGDNELRCNVDATQIAVAIKALIVNAMEAVGTGGNVWIEIRHACAAVDGLGRELEVVVRDDGPGISDAVREHMFDPFFSGREAGRGLGFGLSKCWRIVTDHGGRVVVNEVAGAGAEISIRLPAPTGRRSDHSDRT